MRNLYLIAHLFILTFYACAMGSKSTWLYADRDINKTPWDFCNEKLLEQTDIVDKKSREYACLHTCAKRNKLKKCTEYVVHTRKFTDDKFYHGKWLIIPQ